MDGETHSLEVGLPRWVGYFGVIGVFTDLVLCFLGDDRNEPQPNAKWIPLNKGLLQMNVINRFPSFP